MFEGYFGRRRLKTLIISILISSILLIFIYGRQNVKRVSSRLNRPVETKLPSDSIPLANIQLPSLQPIAMNVLSTIEFTHSPYLNLESHSSNTIPIIVLSRASNIEVRDAIRRTWAFNQLYETNTIDLKVFFLVGTDDYTTKRIHAEQMIFDDVIHVSLPDIDSFIAYKELSAMIWIRTYLPNALFYIKTEDNVIMNINIIVYKLLPIIQNVQNENLVIGWFGSEHVIQRGKYQKFINAVISPSYMNLSYAMSLLYVVTSKASDRMLDTLNNVGLIELPGDPFVTGILRDAAHVQIKNLASNTEDYRYELSNDVCSKEFEKNGQLLLCTSSLLNIGSRNSIPEYFEAWDKLLSQYYK
jgi:hypothetical protein